MALALQDLGVQARSWLGWQIPIHTDEVHGKARIQEIETKELVQRFTEGQVAVIAGFQGLSPRRRITTLGRGGSDTTARSEEHTSELQSLMRISYAVFCLKKKTHKHLHSNHNSDITIMQPSYHCL